MRSIAARRAIQICGHSIREMKESVSMDSHPSWPIVFANVHSVSLSRLLRCVCRQFSSDESLCARVMIHHRDYALWSSGRRLSEFTCRDIECAMHSSKIFCSGRLRERHVVDCRDKECRVHGQSKDDDEGNLFCSGASDEMARESMRERLRQVALLRGELGDRIRPDFRDGFRKAETFKMLGVELERGRGLDGKPSTWTLELARHTSTGVYIAMKVYSKNETARQDALGQLKRDVVALKHLSFRTSRSCLIVRLLDMLQSRESLSCALEYCPFGRLVEQQKHMDLRDASNCVSQLMQAVEYIQNRNVIHCNVTGKSMLIC